MAWPKSMLGQIVLLAVGPAVLGPVYLVTAVLRGQQPLLLVPFLMQYAVPVAVLAWIVADAKERRRTPCFDFGFFLLATWPLSLFWHCWRTRRWRGLALAVGLLLLGNVPMMFIVLMDLGRVVGSLRR